MCPLAKIASLSALASEKAAGRCPATVHVGRCRGDVLLLSNSFVSPSSNCNSTDNVVGLRNDGALQQRGREV